MKVPGPIVNQPLVHNLVGGSDNCASAATADAISGPGTFAVNTTAATTGSPLGTCGAVGNDVWFYWTATSSGTAIVSTCAGVTSDSVIAIWNDGAPAGSCPTTQVLCLDDFCGLQTQVSFPVTAGQKYFIELGGYNGATYSGTFDISIAVPPANDNCATPTVIAGTGTFPFDNTVATAGAEGQTQCLSFGSTAVPNDVWYTWTSNFTGTARVSTCPSFVDTKIVAYSGAGCPAGASIGCNDDACGTFGYQSNTDFAVVNGGVYTIQVGLYPFTTTGGADVFTISQFVPAANDGCATPITLVGNGPHNFDTTIATTGAEGQADPLCLFFGSTSVYNDVWYTWQATGTGTFEVSLCGGTTYDSKLAVYSGSGCPVGAAIACNDDSCGLISAACFSATAGQTYTIQVGAYGPAGNGTGTIQFTNVPPPAGGCTPADDGSSDNSVGWTAGGTFAWIAGFGAPAQSATVSSIDTTYGTPLFPGFYVPQGNVTVAVWDDPNDDGNPNDLVLLGTGTAVVSAGSIDSDVFQTVTLTSPVVANGVFFVGAAVTHNAGEFVGPLDQTPAGGGSCSAGPGSWFFGANAPSIDYTNPSANQYPPQSVASAGFPGNWLVRPNCGPGSTGTAYCFGDGTGGACPCGNTGAAGNGCANSFNAAGANLAATGSAVVGADTVTLNGTGMPGNSTCLYFQGTSQVSVVFGDGLRCAGGSVIRLGTKVNSGGASSYPVGADQDVSVRGLVPSGATRTYQVWYRNSAAFCTPSTFNLSNGLSITWQ